MASHISNNISQVNGLNGSVALTGGASALVRPANAGRLQVWLTNTGSATVYINLGSAAVSGTGIPLVANASVNFTTFSGAIYAISASNGSVAYTEV